MKYCILLLTAFLLSACIDVADFGRYWNQGFRDPCIEAIAYNNYYDDPKPKHIGHLVHSLKVGEHNFLMRKDQRAMKGGSMIRYKVENGEYIAYRLRPEKREEFEKAFPKHKFVITDETVTIPRLSRRSMAIVKTISADESYWEEADRAPYNPTRNLHCKQ